ncbi:MAG: acyl-CoA dehydrogenase [Alphaproteobacteria bacterium]|nr:acyl-CoA dehydrogenase [Alphaproteobacteria bacterium]
MENPFDTDERRAFRDMIRRFVADEVTPHADNWDEAGAIPASLHEKVGALGVFGFGIEEKWGGLGFDDCFMRTAWSEEVAQCGAGGVAAALGARSISTKPIRDLAADSIRDRVLPEIVSGRRSSSLAITEPSGGSDVAGMQTTARRDGGDFVINGQKTFITGGMSSDYFVVGARTSEGRLDGISLFFLEADTPGFSRTEIDRKMGWWCSDQATLYFEECRVPANQLLGEEGRGFLAIVDNFNGERIGLIAGMLGAMKLCLNEALTWARERETFGRPLVHHQVIRHKLAEMSARTDMIEAYLHMICWQVNAGRTPVAEISKAKFSASKALEYCASEAMQILGGAGYLRGNPVERIYREVKVQAIGGGSEEIMRDLAARQMGF